MKICGKIGRPKNIGEYMEYRATGRPDIRLICENIGKYKASLGIYEIKGN